MKLGYLVDTDWCINYLRGEVRTCVRLTQLKPKGLAVSAVTVAELYTGAFRSTRPDKERAGVEDFLISGVHPDEICRVREIGRAVGTLYQISNDYFDWDITNLEERHSRADAWPVNIALPLAAALDAGEPDALLGAMVRKRMLGFDDWKTLLTHIWTKPIREVCEKEIWSARCRATECLRRTRLAQHITEAIHDLCELIVTRDFWYHTYDPNNIKGL